MNDPCEKCKHIKKSIPASPCRMCLYGGLGTDDSKYEVEKK